MKIKGLFRRKNSSYHKEYLKLTVLSLVVVCIAAYIAITHMNRRVNGRFERYIQTISLSEENQNEELEILINFLEEPTLSNKNRGVASNYISILYGFKNQTQESVKYVCRALYYFEKAHENSSLVEARLNLSTILMNTTSYVMAESILQKALDIKLPKDKVGMAQLYIYLNLAESAYQRDNYAQALEAIEIAEDRIEEARVENWCEFSLYLTKARTYFKLENYKECETLTAKINAMVKEDEEKLLDLLALPFYELNSLISLYHGDLEEAKSYFEEYVRYCERANYRLMKLSFIDKYTGLAEEFGYEEEKFVKENKKTLYNEYREQMRETTNLNSKIMMEMYNTSVDNIRIRSEQHIRRAKVYAGVVLVILIMVIGSAMLIQTYKRSQVDILTGAYNRVKMRPVYRALLRKKQTFYVIIFDIDNFKMCNDVYGHRFGDTVLERISGSVMACLPKTSLFFRYGGEEFVVLCELEEEEVKALAETIRKAVEVLEWENQSKITISIGVSRSGSNVDPLKAADECLYVSKKTGKNKVTYSFER